MHSRRRFFAAAAGLAAGVLGFPAGALAGLFRRRRCVVVEPCCPCPSLPTGPTRPVYRSLYIGFTYPLPNARDVYWVDSSGRRNTKAEGGCDGGSAAFGSGFAGEVSFARPPGSSPA